LLIAFFASGCAAPKPYVSDPENSHALNVLRAAGARYIKDVEVEDFEKQKVEGVGHGDLLTSAWLVLFGGGWGTGLSYWGATDDAPEASSHIFAWMPKEMAENGKEANDILRELVAQALGKALTGPDAVEMPEWYEVGDVKQYLVEIEGRDCDKVMVGCQYGIPRRTKPGKMGFAPDFLGSKEAWEFTFNQKNAPWLFFASLKTNAPDSPDTDVYLKASEYLPEWVFLYLAPGISSRTSEGFAPQPYPALLNQGKIYYFVKPE